MYETGKCGFYNPVFNKPQLQDSITVGIVISNTKSIIAYNL